MPTTPPVRRRQPLGHRAGDPRTVDRLVRRPVAVQQQDRKPITFDAAI